jgi:hypothetical protein
VFPPIIPVTPVEPIVIQDGGTLICSIKENLCTGKTSQTISQQLCNLTTDSDVPGPIQPLCWNDGTPTWYPRTRYTMTNSGNKWPTNYKLLVAAQNTCPTPSLLFGPPVLTNVIPGVTSLNALWYLPSIYNNDQVEGFIITIIEFDSVSNLSVIPYTTSLDISWTIPSNVNINEIEGFIITIIEE